MRIEEPDLTEAGGQKSLLDHACRKAMEARENYGPDIRMGEIQAMLEDRSVVRFPTRLRFDAAVLEPGQFAAVDQIGETPAAGFALSVHPHFEDRQDELPLLVAYQLVAVNYGEMADAAIAEVFGATLLGLDREEYYNTLCKLADEVSITE